MNRDRSKAEVWAEIIVTLVSVGLTVWIMAGKPKVGAYACFYGAKYLRRTAANIGTAAIKTEAAYWRLVAH